MSAASGPPSSKPSARRCACDARPARRRPARRVRRNWVACVLNHARVSAAAQTRAYLWLPNDLAHARVQHAGRALAAIRPSARSRACSYTSSVLNHARVPHAEVTAAGAWLPTGAVGSPAGLARPADAPPHTRGVR